MARVRLTDADCSLSAPTLVEGFPGIGLIGKIATDYLVDELEMTYYASVHCDGLPRVGVYSGGERTIRPPVRVYASEEENLLALQSDVPIGAGAAGEVAECLAGWMLDREVHPLFLSGLPADPDESRGVYGVATGDADARLDRLEIDRPPEDGVITGPTGAMLDAVSQREYDATALIADCDPRFPDPDAAIRLLEAGIAPIAEIDVDVSGLHDRAAEIRDHREEFARRMREMGEEGSSQAQPLQMYQ